MIEVTAGAYGLVQGLSILQYANHTGLDFVSSHSDMEPSLWPCCLEAGDSIFSVERIRKCTQSRGRMQTLTQYLMQDHQALLWLTVVSYIADLEAVSWRKVMTQGLFFPELSSIHWASSSDCRPHASE